MNFNFSYKDFWRDWIAPLLRKTRMLKWGEVLLQPLQSLHDFIFGDYSNGANYPTWAAGTFSIGDRVVYLNRNVYECIQAHTGSPVLPPTNASYWKLINTNYIGIRERVRYNSQKMVFEFALNRYFQCSGIYIQNNPINLGSFLMGQTGQYSSIMSNDSAFQTQYMSNAYIPSSTNYYTIFVPLAVYNNLSAVSGDREKIVRSFADIYNLAGMTYDVQTY